MKDINFDKIVNDAFERALFDMVEGFKNDSPIPIKYDDPEIEGEIEQNKILINYTNTLVKHALQIYHQEFQKK
jgi:hypothetical protein